MGAGPGRRRRVDVTAWGRPTRRPARSWADPGSCLRLGCVSRGVRVHSLRLSPFASSQPPGPAPACHGAVGAACAAPLSLRGGERGSGSPCLPVSGRAEVGPGGGRWEAAAGWARTSGGARLGGGEASRGGGQPGRFRFRSAFRGVGRWREPVALTAKPRPER